MENLSAKDVITKNNTRKGLALLNIVMIIEKIIILRVLTENKPKDLRKIIRDL